jgi:hypothetical protein
MNFVGTDDEDNAAGGQMAELTWKHGYQMFWAVGGILTLTVVFLMHRKVSDPPRCCCASQNLPYRTVPPARVQQASPCCCLAAWLPGCLCLTGVRSLLCCFAVNLQGVLKSRSISWTNAIDTKDEEERLQANKVMTT